MSAEGRALIIAAFAGYVWTAGSLPVVGEVLWRLLGA